MRRCEEVLRRIQTIEDECKNLSVPCDRLKDKQQIFTCFDSLVSKSQVSELKMFEKIEEEIRIKYEYFKSQQAALHTLEETLEEQVRRKVILTSAASIIRGDQEVRHGLHKSQGRNEDEEKLLEEKEMKSYSINPD